MKKIYTGIVSFIILILMANLAFATQNMEKENKKREEAFKLATDSYMKTFMTEETPQEDRITAYEYTGFGIGAEGETEDKLPVTLSIYVTPANESNTTWSKGSNCCFAVFSKVNDEYVLDRISRYPDNYDKFLERFEEYKKNNMEAVKTETLTIQGEGQNNLASSEIEKINSNLMLGFGVLFILSSVLLVICIRKKLKILQK